MPTLIIFENNNTPLAYWLKLVGEREEQLPNPELIGSAKQERPKGRRACLISWTTPDY